MARVYPLAFYNLDNNRPPGVMEAEVRSILNGWRPAILGVCEAVGYNLPGVEDYRVLRDTSRPGRENVAAYVKTNLAVEDVKWHDLAEQWTRPKDPPNQHWPRSILEFRAARLFVEVAHQPPKGTDNTKAAQSEGIDKLTARMAPWTRDDWEDRPEEDRDEAKAQPRVVLWDANRRPDESGPGPATLANNIDGWPVGGRIDGAVIRGRDVTASGVEYPTHAGGVELCSDHGCAFRFEFEVPD